MRMVMLSAHLRVSCLGSHSQGALTHERAPPASIRWKGRLLGGAHQHDSGRCIQAKGARVLRFKL